MYNITIHIWRSKKNYTYKNVNFLILSCSLEWMFIFKPGSSMICWGNCMASPRIDKIVSITKIGAKNET